MPNRFTRLASGPDAVKAQATTTDATPTALTLLDNTEAGLKLPDQTTWAFDILVVGRRTGATEESGAYRIVGAIKRETGAATTVLLGVPTVTTIGETIVGWDAAAAADTVAGALRLTVTGAAASNVKWLASVRLLELTAA